MIYFRGLRGFFECHKPMLSLLNCLCDLQQARLHESIIITIIMIAVLVPHPVWVCLALMAITLKLKAKDCWTIFSCKLLQRKRPAIQRVLLHRLKKVPPCTHTHTHVKFLQFKSHTRTHVHTQSHHDVFKLDRIKRMGFCPIKSC